MYIPNHFKMNELFECHHFINEYSFGIIINTTLTGSHLPFILNKSEGEFGTLYAHCARANPHYKEFQNNEVLIIFNGPHSYISPAWYAQSPAVPTWNYAAVHAYGKVTLLDKNATLNTVNNMVKNYEPDLLDPESVMTEEYTKKLLAGVVGFKIEITKIEGKQKLGQQKKQADQQGVYQSLSKSNQVSAQELARYMKKNNIGIGE